MSGNSEDGAQKGVKSVHRKMVGLEQTCSLDGCHGESVYEE